MKWLIALVLVAACGGRPPIPKRGVVEGDLGEWKFRRFQPVLDVEVWVAGNKAEAYTAVYVREQGEKRGHLEDDDLVDVFVTRYKADKGVLREAVKFARRLAQEGGYTVDESKIGGVRAVTINGHGEAWVLWASELHVVKVGGRNRDSVPDSVIASYGDRYPSTFYGGVLEGPLPGEEPELEHKDPDQPYDPNNPQPDWEKYDPKAADKKIEESKQKREQDEEDDEDDDDKPKGKGKN